MKKIFIIIALSMITACATIQDKLEDTGANTRLADMTQDNSLGMDSIFYSVDDPSGTPADRKVTAQEIADTVIADIVDGDLPATIMRDSELDGAITINDSGNDADFRVEGSGQANALFVQGSDGFVGIGTNSPSQALDLIGDAELENTTHANESGIIYKGSSPFISDFNYGNNGSVTTVGGNSLLGKNAGNLSMGSTATETYHSSYNVFVGENAGNANTTGYSNVFSGTASGALNTTGYSNTFVGTSSGNSNTTGNSNVYIGENAGRYITDGSTPNETTTTSVLIGNSTKVSADGDSNEVVIGHNVTGAGSNSVTIGNSSITKTLLQGDVGIDTVSPSSELDVSGTVTATLFSGSGASLTGVQLSLTEGNFVDGDKTEHDTLVSRVDQDVTSGSSPTFDVTNMTGIPDEVDECKGQTFQTFGSSDATPDVSNGASGVFPCWIVHQSTSPTVTDFDDGDDHSEFTQGDKFLLLVNYTTVIDFSDNSNIEGNSNIDFTGSTTQITWLSFQYDGTRWVEKTLPGKSSPNVLSISSIQVTTLEASELNDTSDPHLLTVSELQTHYISNYESVGADEWDFPAQAEGWDFCFVKETDQNVTLDPNGTEQWYFRTDNSAYTQLSAGEAIVNTTSGKSALCCFSTEQDVFCTGDANWAEETP